MEGADVSRRPYQSERYLGNYQYASREELSIRVFQQNAFPQNYFSTKGFKKMQESTMGKNQGGLGNSFFLWGVLHSNIYLISQRTSWWTIPVFKYLLIPPTTTGFYFFCSVWITLRNDYTGLIRRVAGTKLYVIYFCQYRDVPLMCSVDIN